MRPAPGAETGAIGSSLRGALGDILEDKMSPVLSALLSVVEYSHHQKSLRSEILLPICYLRAEHNRQNRKQISWGVTDYVFLIPVIFVYRDFLSFLLTFYYYQNCLHRVPRY